MIDDRLTAELEAALVRELAQVYAWENAVRFGRRLTPAVLVVSDAAISAYLAGDYAAAVEAASQVQRLLWTAPSPLEAADFHLYGALSHAAVCDSATADERQQHVEVLAAHHRQLAVWAEHGPENFENRAALVGAEIARLDGRRAWE